MSLPYQILMIADCISEREGYLRQFLLEAAFHVHCLSHSQMAEILALCRSQPIASILLEFASDDSLVRLLKQQLGEICPPIIAIGINEVEVAVRAFKDGASDYLVRSCLTADTLQTAINQAISQHHSLQSASCTGASQPSLETVLDCLQESQRHYQDLAEAMPQMVWTADVNGAVNYWNQRWYDYTGLSASESLGLMGVSVVHPEERDRTLAQWQYAVEAGASFQIEYRVRRWDGVYHWFICRAIPTGGGEGQITGWIGTLTDINERKQIEDRLALVLQAVNGLIYDWSLETGEVYRSEQLLDLVGFLPEAVPPTATWWYDRIHPDDLARLRPRVEAMFAGSERLINSEYRVRHREGHWVVVWERSCLIRDSQGQVIRVVGATVDISDRKRTELDLRETHIQLESALSSGCIYSWRWNIPDNLIFANQSFAHLFGLKLEDITAGLPLEYFLNSIHPDDRSQVVAAIERAIATGETYATEYRIRDAAGQTRWVIARGQVEYDSNGSAVAFPGVLTDITDRKRSEEALRISEAEFRTIANAAPAIVWVTSVTGECIFMNERWQEYSGQPLEESLGSGWMAFLHPDDLARILTYWQHCCETGETYEGELRYRSKEGEYRWHRFRALPRRNEAGEIEKWFGCSVDIHDTKRIEELTLANEARLRGFVEANVVGILYGDIHGNIHEANDELLRIVGYTREDLRSGRLRWIDITPPEELLIDEQAISEARLKGACTPYEKHYIRKDGSRVPVLVGYSLVGEVREESVAFILDLSQQKQAEREREQLLQREQLARQEAERANRIKDEFLAVLSHELRSPLNPILGWAKLLQTGNFDANKTAEALATIERNAKLQAQLIDDLLDVAKILRGKLTLQIAPVDLAFVVESAIDTVRAAAAAKTITLHYTLPAIGPVSGDAVRLQQVVWNLLSNAIKFTPIGGRVEVKLESYEFPVLSSQFKDTTQPSTLTTQPSTLTTQPSTLITQPFQRYAQITVTDTGKGIKPDFLPHIFESFCQEDASTTRKFGGLGLGLAIVRQLVEAHGGMITADSDGEGQGARFTVQLPLLSRAVENQQGQEPQPQELSLTDLQILVVDDEPDARELLTVLLAQYGAQVTTATSAAEVLAVLDLAQPDLLVSDIAMPDVDGYSLIQQIRALPSTKGGQIPAIALTAYAREDDRQKAMDHGYQGYVTKPIEPDQLIQTVLAVVVQAQCSARSPCQDSLI